MPEYCTCLVLRRIRTEIKQIRPFSVFCPINLLLIRQNFRFYFIIFLLNFRKETFISSGKMRIFKSKINRFMVKSIVVLAFFLLNSVFVIFALIHYFYSTKHLLSLILHRKISNKKINLMYNQQYLSRVYRCTNEFVCSIRIVSQ